MEEMNRKEKVELIKKCFVIMPISDVPNYPQGHFDRVFEHIVVPACKKVGYEAIRVDVTAKTNVIIVDILKNVVDCDMAICDLSARNPNVFYELGFRQAFGKKTVLMIDERTERPFDISSIRSFQYGSSLRIDLVDKAINDLAMALQETQSMNDNEPNSLLNLLSIENLAILPNKQKLSAENALILQEIKNISDRLQPNNFSKHQINSFSCLTVWNLSAKYSISIGSHLYVEHTLMEYGVVVDILSEGAVVKKIYDNSIGVLSDLDLAARHLIARRY